MPLPHWLSAVQAAHAPAAQIRSPQFTHAAVRSTPQALAVEVPVTKLVPLQQLFAGFPQVSPQQTEPAPPLQVWPL